MTASFSRANYIDSSGNEITRSTYESLLAHEILEHPEYWKDFFDKISQKIIEIMNSNKDNHEFMDGLSEGRHFIERTFPEITSTEKLIQEFSQPSEVKDAYTDQFRFNVYKFFVERAFPAAKVLPGSKLLVEEDKGMDRDYFRYLAMEGETWRPDHLFSYFGRGREYSGVYPCKTVNAGLTSMASTPAKLKDKFAVHPIKPASIQYKRIASSTTVKEMEKHFVPFGSGPSGTLGYVVAAVEMMLGVENITPEDYRKLYMGLIAYLVYEGHHSFAEIGMILNEVKNAKTCAFAIDPTLSAKEYYDQYITEEFRLSDVYHKFTTTNHPNKYSAMSWEILRDALYEHKQRRGDESKITTLKGLCDQGKEKHAELDVADLEKLKGVLRELKDESECAETGIIVAKLIKKLTDSGITLAAIPLEEEKAEASPEVIPSVGSNSFFIQRSAEDDRALIADLPFYCKTFLEI